ncbi:hypothetical protein [Desmospora activa]|uniref:Uncharacterized protein n=1 Tax=Desmospora activa DSM 45169 TaxID=1121389 RepID=A0A2T4Z3F9_9BACL|nr:hypothetical protein [Desmospora activa]PTM56428.1 hypothetical protein C8J48_2750 [Desmospora activa DSM 45169]
MLTNLPYIIAATGASIFALGFGLLIEKTKLMKKAHDINVSFWSSFLVMAVGSALFFLGHYG